MDFYIRFLHHTLVIRVYGAFDYSKSLKLQEFFQGSKIVKYSNVLFDFTSVTTIDTSGVGLILSLAQQVKKRGGRIRMVNASPHLRDTLEFARTSGLEAVRFSKDTFPG